MLKTLQGITAPIGHLITKYLQFRDTELVGDLNFGILHNYLTFQTIKYYNAY